MPNVIIKSSLPTEREINLAKADIVEAEYAKERAEAEKRDQTARWVAQNFHSPKTIPGLGKCIAVVPLLDDLRLRDKYGRHMEEKSFWQYYQKHHKEMCPAKV